MRRFVFIAVLFFSAMTPSATRAQSMAPDAAAADGYLAGREAGRTAHTYGAALLGLASGIAGGIAIPVVVSGSGEDMLFGASSVGSIAVFVGALRLGTHVPRRYESRLQGETPEFTKQFRKGYADEVHRQRIVPAILGGTVGAALGGAFVWWVANVIAD